MREIKFIKTISLILLSLIPINESTAEKIILSLCDNNKDGFLKNEYILDLEKSIMTRNYIYNQTTYQKYKMSDLSVNKSC